ncbi:hypothetical protein BRD17_02975 [Halobacteriales archaeon SW_7_68_16]|nr:MAG: hypothetical protein BRD17_02975 [Halobacteriales archaeon SW_7_68_16]
MGDLPRGPVPRVEVQWSHREFLDAVEPDTAMMKLTHARRLVKRDESLADFFGPDTTVITTSTVSDENLNLITWERELAIVEELEPAFHVPTDYPTYQDDDDDERFRNVQNCMEGTLWMADRLADAETDLIPLVKGFDRRERELCYRTAEELGVERCAFYGVQYFDGAIRIDDLVTDVSTIADESGFSILLIGLMSPTTLRRMPPEVVAAAGQTAWRQEIKPRKHDPATMRHVYDEIAEDVTAALSQPHLGGVDGDRAASADG